MGELQLETTTSDDLFFVPSEELRRLRAEGLEPEVEARLLAHVCRINTLYMIARAWSGHIGTSFSAVDLMCWIFRRELRNLDEHPDVRDLFLSSKGHDAPAMYAVLMALGFLEPDLIHRLRRLGGLPGHPHVGTPYISSNTGSLGMGISKAKGLVLAARLRRIDRRVFVMTGDGELQEGQVWESLQQAANLGLHEITAVVDHNKIQSDGFVNEVSDLGALPDKFRAFGWHVEQVDGHDFGAMRDVFHQLRHITSGPKVVIAHTVKGKGVSFMEGSRLTPGQLYEYHSGAPDEDAYARASNELLAAARAGFEAAGLEPLKIEVQRRPPRKAVVQGERLVSAYSRALVHAGARNSQLVALDADLVKDCGLLEFRNAFPDRFIECGIAEQDMVSTAAGLARGGMLPVVHSFACFLATRPHEQIYNQCSEGSKVMYVGSLAGLLPGGPGHSHQAVWDIGSLASIPNLVMAEPSTERETELLVEHFLNDVPGSTYLRLTSVGWRVPFSLPGEYRPEVGRGVIVREGADLVVFGYGPWMLANAWEAAEQLARQGISVRIVNHPWLNRVNRAWLREAIGQVKLVIALDNHYVDAGQGQMLAAAIAELGLEGLRPVQRLGVNELPKCGTNEEVLAYHRLDVAGLAAAFATATSDVRPVTT